MIPSIIPKLMRLLTAAFTTTLAAMSFSAAHAQTWSGDVGYYINTTSTQTDNAKKMPVSNQFTVEVKGSDGNWKNAMTLISRAAETGTKMAPAFPNHSPTDLNVENHYYDNILGWTHSYTNLVYKNNKAIEVAITKTGVTINASTTKIYPADKVSNISVSGNKLLFTLVANAQVVIDINGEYGNSTTTTYIPPNTQLPNNVKYHTLSVHSNPEIPAPTTGLFTVAAGSARTGYDAFNSSTTTAMVFGPGVHNLGMDFKLKHGATYYIPGDAIVFGTFNNLITAPDGSQTNPSYTDAVNKVTISGHGTISGSKIMHWDVANTENGSAAMTNAGKIMREDRSERKYALNIVNCDEVYSNGITLADPANHGTKYIYFGGYKVNDSGANGSVQSTKFVKVFGWRLNSDGGGCTMNSRVENIFYRVQDDMLYPHGKSINDCVLWTDSNGTIRFDNLYDVKAQNKQVTYKGFDVIFNRSVFSDGATVSAREMNSGKDYTNLNVAFENIHVSDPNPKTMLFNMVPTQNLSGVTFTNVKAANFFNPSELKPTSPGFLNTITFSNLDIQGAIVTNSNYSNRFTLNSNVNISTHNINFLGQVLANGVYTLRNQAPSSRYVAAPLSGSALRSLISTAGNDTLWTFTHVSNNYYTITSKKTGYTDQSIEVPNANFTINAPLGLWYTSTTDNGKSWLLEKLPNGNFRLRPKGAETTKAMDGGEVNRTYPTSWDNVIHSNQEFTIAP